VVEARRWSSLQPRLTAIALPGQDPVSIALRAHAPVHVATGLTVSRADARAKDRIADDVGLVAQEVEIQGRYIAVPRLS
jgi:hypothetical protein